MTHTETKEGMSLIVRTATRWLKAFIFLFGMYVLLYGHLMPGGGFAGGVIVACALILVTLADGQKIALRMVSKNVAAGLAAGGALLVLGIGLAGMLLNGSFFKNFLNFGHASESGVFGGGTIQWIEAGVTLVVGLWVFVAFSILAATRVAVRGGKRKMIHRGRE